MRDVFIIDNSIFEDALTEDGRKEFKESSTELLNLLFKFKLDNITIGYIPEEAYKKFVNYFIKLNKTKTISLISEIVDVEPPIKNGQKVFEAISNLAYKFTLIPQKSYLVTNNPLTFQRLLQSDRMFYVINSNDAVKIIKHPNFLCQEFNKNKIEN